MKETYSRESKVAIKALNNFTKKYIFMDSLDSPNTLLVCASPDIPPKEANKETKTIFILLSIRILHIWLMPVVTSRRPMAMDL